ncbi:MAG: hypothetical protein MK008_09340 [Bdellovibrionales bacterium]|nr:hypothetical protein [Bdellovibrionales bacterium]
MKTLIITISLLISFAASAAVEHVHMKNTWGFERVYSSDDLDFLLTPVEGLPVSTSATKRDHLLCRDKLPEHLMIERTEKIMELGAMLRSLQTREKLSLVDRKTLKRIPDCKPFRFHLHMISKVLSGYELKQIK